MTNRRWGMLFILALASMTGHAQEKADLVLRGGKIVTMNPQQPQAEAIAILGSRIARVGSAREIEAMIGPGTRVIELNGRLVVPGFIRIQRRRRPLALAMGRSATSSLSGNVVAYEYAENRSPSAQTVR